MLGKKFSCTELNCDRRRRKYGMELCAVYEIQSLPFCVNRKSYGSKIIPITACRDNVV